MVSPESKACTSRRRGSSSGGRPQHETPAVAGGAFVEGLVPGTAYTIPFRFLLRLGLWERDRGPPAFPPSSRRPRALREPAGAPADSRLGHHGPCGERRQAQEADPDEAVQRAPDVAEANPSPKATRWPTAEPRPTGTSWPISCG